MAAVGDVVRIKNSDEFPGRTGVLVEDKHPMTDTGYYVSFETDLENDWYSTNIPVSLDQVEKVYQVGTLEPSTVAAILEHNLGLKIEGHCYLDQPGCVGHEEAFTNAARLILNIVEVNTVTE